MPLVEIALANSFTRHIDPITSIIEITTCNPWLLSSTPIIMVKEGIASQLVYSAPPHKPWGITPVCRKCKGLVRATKSGHGPNFANHEKLKFRCCTKGCSEEMDKFRPAWVTTIKDRPHFFIYQYPLTSEQKTEVWCL